MPELSDRGREVAYALGEMDEAVSHDYIIENTSVESVRESKEVLRELLDFGLLTTTPGFKYRLANNDSAAEFRE